MGVASNISAVASASSSKNFRAASSRDGNRNIGAAIKAVTPGSISSVQVVADVGVSNLVSRSSNRLRTHVSDGLLRLCCGLNCAGGFGVVQAEGDCGRCNGDGCTGGAKAKEELTIVHGLKAFG